jgi:hypothetical protein
MKSWISTFGLALGAQFAGSVLVVADDLFLLGVGGKLL